uniref:Uncharacterized protein n=1 Tax=Electrophorus electricus TaxID=8005 RepID=A0A4W4GDF1_ELEEL
MKICSPCLCRFLILPFLLGVGVSPVKNRKWRDRLDGLHGKETHRTKRACESPASSWRNVSNFCSEVCANARKWPSYVDVCYEDFRYVKTLNE